MAYPWLDVWMPFSAHSKWVKWTRIVMLCDEIEEPRVVEGLESHSDTAPMKLYGMYH